MQEICECSRTVGNYDAHIFEDDFVPKLHVLSLTHCTWGHQYMQQNDKLPHEQGVTG